MISLKLSRETITNFVSEEELTAILPEIAFSHSQLLNKTGKGNDFLGWVDLPSQIDETLFDKIDQDVQRFFGKAEIVVVIGIGGSYLGARAVIDALSDPFASLEKQSFPRIVYAGNSISQDYHAQLLQLLDKKDYGIIVISKSGTTTEPAIAFRILKNHIEKKYGKVEARNRIIAVTDQSRGALKKLSENEGYPSYVIPDDVGGRYSVFTPVGLLPIAMAGFDIRKLIAGALQMQKACIQSADPDENPAVLYAALRNVLYRKGAQVEILVNYEPALHYITEWWKQLFGESEGKGQEGIFPAGVDFTCDLHSMGQYIQDGQRIIFETVLSVEQPNHVLTILPDAENLDGMNFIAGKSLHEVNQMATLGTVLAHMDGEVPNIGISMPKIDEHSLGELLYFFEFACGLSGYTLGVNPFDQPGVEAYKNNMFALLGKPGFEKEGDLLRARLKQV